jgi:hypothetical protein
VSVSFETHEVRALVKQFEDATGGPARKDVEAVVFKGAMNIKKDAARRASGFAHAPRYPGSIDFDMHYSLRGPAAEIGPNKSKAQGALGNLIEFGSVNNPAHPHMGPAGEAEEPKFGKALEDLAAKRFER